MKHFINLKDIPAKDLIKIINDAKKRKSARKKLNHLEIDKGAPLKGKLLIQMFEKSSLRTRLSFYLAIKQLGGSALTLRSDELHLSKGGESIEDTAKILSNFGILVLKVAPHFNICLHAPAGCKHHGVKLIGGPVCCIYVVN